MEQRITPRVPNITVTSTSPAMETDKNVSEMNDLIISPRRKQSKDPTLIRKLD
jgi:hypothetical protein